MAIFLAKILPRKMAKLLTLQFSRFFLLKLVFFFKNLILPAERRRFLKNKKHKKKQMAKLLTYDGQVIDPTAHIYKGGLGRGCYDSEIS